MRGFPTLPWIALAVLGLGAEARAEEPIEVTVRGSTAGGYASRTGTDTALREPVDAASLLEELPSVHVRRLGAEGAFASISVRGSAPAQVGVVLGGIPLTSAADPAFDVGALPLWPGASFRVYRGFAPAALGTTGYLGGVLAIDPPSATTGGRTEWSAYGGSFGALKLRLGDLRRVNGVEIGTGFFASRSDGDFSFEREQPVGSGHLVEQQRLNASQRVVGGIARVAVEEPWGSVAVLLFADARRLGVPGADIHPTRFATLSTSRVIPALEASIRTGESGAIRLLAWGRREGSSLADPLGEIDPTHTTTTTSTIEAAGLSAGWRGRPIDPLTLALVIDERGERFLAGASRGLGVSAPVVRLALGAGADVEWRASDRLTVSAAARIDLRRDDASGSTSPDGKPLGQSGDVAPTGHAGASYRFAPEAVISAHVGALSRPPAFQELFGNGASLFANPKLLPERAWSADAGIHGDVGNARVVFGYEVVAFGSLASNLITFAPLGLGTFRAQNIASALLGGAEITASLAARGVRSQVTYTLLFTQDRATGNPLPGRPQHDLAYDASWRFGPLRARYGLDVVAGLTYGTDGPIAMPPRVLHGVGIALDVPEVPGLRASLDVQNLFDVRTFDLPSPALSTKGMTGYVTFPVSDFLGFPLPGRTFWASLRFSRESRGAPSP